MALTQISDAGLKKPASDLQDNEKIVLGTGNDFEIFHDGSDSWIKHDNGGNGSLVIKSTTVAGSPYGLYLDSDFTGLRNEAQNEYYLKATNGAAVELYYNNNQRFFTETDGVTIKGNEGGEARLYFYADEGDDNADKIHFAQDTSGNLRIRHYDGSNWNTRWKINSDGDLEAGDNIELRLGAGDDFKLYHDGSHNILLGVNGADFKIKDDSHNSAIFDTSAGVYLYYDNIQRFETSSTGAKVSGRLDVDGDLISHSANNNSLGLTGHRWNDLFIANDIDILDNSVILIGTGNDLNIWHDGSNSNIENQTGQLRIRGSYIFLRSQDAQETHAQFTVNGSSELYYDNSRKFRTVSSGTEVTGSEWITEGTIYLEKSGAHHHRILANDSGNDLAFQQSSDTGANTNFTTYLRIKDGGDISLPVDNKKLVFGAGNDLELHSDGENGQVTATQGNLWLRSDTNIFLSNEASDEYFLKAINNGAVELYHNHVKTLETTSNGAIIAGTSGANVLSIRNTTLGNGHVGILFSTQNHSGGREKAAIFHHETHGQAHYGGDLVIALNTAQGGAAQVSLSDRKATFKKDGGLCFGSDTAYANALDDYEEGSFTPTITGLGNHTNNASATWGKYQKVGNTVTIHFKYQWTSRNTTGGSSVYLESLPFTCNANQRGTVCVSGIEGVESNAGREHYGGQVVLNTSTILFRASGHDISENSLYGSNSTSLSSGYIYGHAIYEV